MNIKNSTVNITGKHTTNNRSTCNNTWVYISINNVFAIATPNTEYKETTLSAFQTKTRNKYQHNTSKPQGHCPLTYDTVLLRELTQDSE
jgi:hypothetical protein